MFKGLLNRVRVDLVRICVKCSFRRPIKGQHRPMEGIDRVSVRP
jgi:hypothetical protein